MAYTLGQQTTTRGHSQTTRADLYWLLGVTAIICFAFFFARKTNSATYTPNTSVQVIPTQATPPQLAPGATPAPAMGTHFGTYPSGIYNSTGVANQQQQMQNQQDPNSWIYDHTNQSTTSPNSVNTNNSTNAPLMQH